MIKSKKQLKTRVFTYKNFEVWENLGFDKIDMNPKQPIVIYQKRHLFEFSIKDTKLLHKTLGKILQINTGETV